MTEREWLTCTDPPAMLEFLAGKVSNRKLRLFACGCCRSAWHFLKDQRSQEAVEMAERFADARASKTELDSAMTRAYEVPYTEDYEMYEHSSHPAAIVDAAAHAATFVCSRAGGSIPLDVVSSCADAVSFAVGQQARLLRDIFNPFRPVSIDTRWLTSTVVDLAQAIYEERAFDRMPILADALMDAGCDSDDIIQHCRGPGPHVRGCFVVDAILGKS